MHASLLPRWRGAAPIQRAILAGDAATGVTIMQMDAGLDTGPMLLPACRWPSRAVHTAGALHDELVELGAAALLEALTGSRAGTTHAATPQPAEGVTYAAQDREGRGAHRLGPRAPARSTGRCARSIPGPWPRRVLDGEQLRIYAAAHVADCRRRQR